ncbi:hypothetical protein [Mycoplasma todarodis]|uniref:Nucleotidyltransferase n=1 Tax=Mycoplasma todarodis TaxID=1937191 RepID=A0A4R0XN28_9MOLU|nr:hypothetical protein [Mycoplasma todarodis]TCG11961.1 hypothetical protein C4B25_00455 [Mycoplasma todarodis]
MECKKCENTKCKYVGKKTAKKQRKEIWDILKQLNKKLKENNRKGFMSRLVGSSRRNMVFRHGNSMYDTDIQLEFLSPTAKKLEPEFKDELNEMIKEIIPETWTTKISTSVITINKCDDEGKLVHFFDLAILRKKDDTRQILRGKSSDKTKEDYFKWEALSKYNKAYDKFKEASKDQIQEIKQRYLERKCENRGVKKDDLNHRSSSQFFVEVVNEVMD